MAPLLPHAARADRPPLSERPVGERGLVRAERWRRAKQSAAQAYLSRNIAVRLAAILTGAEARAALCAGGPQPPALRLEVQGAVTPGAREFEARSAEDS